MEGAKIPGGAVEGGTDVIVTEQLIPPHRHYLVGI